MFGTEMITNQDDIIIAMNSMWLMIGSGIVCLGIGTVSLLLLLVIRYIYKRWTKKDNNKLPRLIKYLYLLSVVFIISGALVLLICSHDYHFIDHDINESYVKSQVDIFMFMCGLSFSLIIFFILFIGLRYLYIFNQVIDPIIINSILNISHKLSLKRIQSSKLSQFGKFGKEMKIALKRKFIVKDQRNNINKTNGYDRNSKF